MTTAQYKSGSGIPTYAAPEGSLYSREAAGLGSLYLRRNSIWEELARNAAGAITITSLALGSGLPGQALIVNPGGTAWAAGGTGSHNDFADRNLTTTGTLSIGAGIAGNPKTTIQPVVGSTNFGGIYITNAAPSATNWTIQGDSTGATNAAINGSIGVTLCTAGITSWYVTDGLLRHANTAFSPVVSQLAPTTDAVTHDFTIQSQAPWVSAGTNKNPGNLVLSTPTPVAGGVDSYVKINTGAALTWWFGRAGALAANGNCIWPGTAAPNDFNWALAHNPNSGNDIIALNSPGANVVGSLTGGRINFGVAGLGVVSFYSDGLYFYPGNTQSTTAAFNISQRARTTDAAASDLTISSQAPFATATVNKNPGNIVLSVPAPISGGAGGYVRMTNASSTAWSFNYGNFGSPAYASIWGPVTPSATNYALSYGTTAGVDFTYLNVGGSTGQLVLSIAGNSIVVATNTAVFLERDTLHFDTTLSGVIGQRTQISDIAVHDLTLISQAAFAGATGTNRNSGNLLLATPAPVAGGTAGSIKLQPSATTTVTAKSTGVIQFNVGYGLGIIHSDASGNLSSSKIIGTDFDSTGFSANQAYVWNGSAFVATTVGAGGGGTITGVTAGAGLIGGGSSGTITLDIVAADGTIVVAADSIRVGTVPWTQLSGVPDASTTVKGIVQLAGDLAGTATSVIVARLNGATVPAAGSLNTSHVLKVSSVSSLTYGFITNTNISDVDWTKVGGRPTTLVGYGITDAVPSSRSIFTTFPLGGGGSLSGDLTLSVAVSSTSAQGTIRLAGDIGGVGATPLVIGLTGTASVVAVHGATLAWDPALTPKIYQIDDPTASVVGKLFTLQAQNATGSGATGGTVHVRAGTGTSLHGNAILISSGNLLASTPTGSYTNQKFAMGTGTLPANGTAWCVAGDFFQDFDGTKAGGAIRLASNGVASYFVSNAYYAGGANDKRSRAGGASYMIMDTSTGATAGDIVFGTAPNGAQDSNITIAIRLIIKQLGHLFLPNVSAHPTTPSGGSYVYTLAGRSYIMDTSGIPIALGW